MTIEINKVSDNSKKLKEYLTSQKLLSHSFFNRLQDYINLKITCKIINNPVKHKMAFRFMEIYTLQLYEFAHYYITSQIYKEGKSLREYLPEVCDAIFMVCATDGIPDIFIKKFRQTHDKTFESTLIGFDNISKSNIFNNEEERCNANLDLLLFYLLHFSMTTEIAINEMNGELQKSLESIPSEVINQW